MDPYFNEEHIGISNRTLINKYISENYLSAMLQKYFFYKIQLSATYSSAHTFLFVWRSVVKISHTLLSEKVTLFKCISKAFQRPCLSLKLGPLGGKLRKIVDSEKKIQNWISHYALQPFCDPFVQKQENPVFGKNRSLDSTQIFTRRKRLG